LTIAARIRRLTLTNFRSYRAASVSLGDGPVVLTGANGAGKTNVLEAISILGPGRGLRYATLEEMACSEGAGAWAVSAEIEGALGIATLGTGVEAAPGEEPAVRRSRIDREPVPASALADHLRVLWLVPSMDGLFAGPASDRRRFLDRLVLATDAAHGTRVHALERALRSRNRLLENAQADARWLDAVEHEAAELAVAVASARSEAVSRLATALAARRDASFPSAQIALDGWASGFPADAPAVEVEDRYRAVLKANRPRDAAAGRATEGPHLTDLLVIYAPKSVPARDASTGEQKALLIGLVLAHANLVAEMTGVAPVILLDEVVAHLDPSRRAALFDALAQLGAQVWMTGADPVAFADIAGRAQVFEVENGRLALRD